MTLGWAVLCHPTHTQPLCKVPMPKRCHLPTSLSGSNSGRDGRPPGRGISAIPLQGPCERGHLGLFTCRGVPSSQGTCTKSFGRDFFVCHTHAAVITWAGRYVVPTNCLPLSVELRKYSQKSSGSSVLRSATFCFQARSQTLCTGEKQATTEGGRHTLQSTAVRWSIPCILASLLLKHGLGWSETSWRWQRCEEAALSLN